MNAAALKLNMDAAEVDFDKSVAALKQARADRKRSKGKKTLEALQSADEAYDVALTALKRASLAYSKALAAEVQAMKASAAPQIEQGDLFA